MLYKYAKSGNKRTQHNSFEKPILFILAYMVLHRSLGISCVPQTLVINQTASSLGHLGSVFVDSDYLSFAKESLR